MLASLKLEVFGHNTQEQWRLASAMVDSSLPGCASKAIGTMPSSCWVAKLIPWPHRLGFDREFVPCKTDYSKANSKGSRGVFRLYVLESGSVYEVKRKTSWRSEERFFCTVSEDGDVLRMTKEEVGTWLAN